MLHSFRGGGGEGGDDVDVPTREHVRLLLSLQPIQIRSCLFCRQLLLPFEKDYSCCGCGTKQHCPWTPPPSDVVEVIMTPGFGNVSRIVNNLFTTAVLYSGDEGITYHLGAGPPAMRVQGALYARMMRTTTNFWFVADARYGQGYDQLPARYKVCVHVVHRALLRDNILFKDIHPNLPHGHMPRVQDLVDGDIVVSASEAFLSAVYVCPGGVGPKRSLVLPERGVILGSRSVVTEDSPLWERVLYPIWDITGNGERWRKKQSYPLIRRQQSSTLSLLAYLKSVILHEKYFWYCTRLAQQYIIDCWTRNEAMMVKYWMTPAFQARIRAFLPNNRVVPDGKIFLPSGYPGTHRYAQRNYQDAVFISSQGGSPHIFLTMTANPNWPEVRAMLPEGQSANERPDLIARVFQQKVFELIEKLGTAQYLFPTHQGVEWLVYTVEWQQGGLPHIHMAVRLEISSPMTTTVQQLSIMESFISARLPPPNTTEYHLVKEFMMHAHPCKHCIRKRRDGTEGCRFYFPKQPSLCARIDNRGFPVYSRGEEDLWVVPHCQKLLRDFLCHINVEWTLCSTCLGYLYKYINKAQDASGFKISENLDEIAAFRRARVFSVSEAIWRTLRFVLNFKHPAVMMCSIRLPRDYLTLEAAADYAMEHDAHDSGEIRVDDGFEFDGESYDENNEIPDEDDGVGGVDDLMQDQINRYFARERDLDMTYTQFFAWWYRVKPRDAASVQRNVLQDRWYEDQWGSFWKKRESAIYARMPWFGPKSGEIHYLRLLLLEIPARGWHDLLRNFRTFREAAIDAGLVDTDTEAITVLLDSVREGFPGSSIRRLFVSLLLNHTRSIFRAWSVDRIRNAIVVDFEASSARGEVWEHSTAVQLCLMDLAITAFELDEPIHDRMEACGLPQIPLTVATLCDLAALLPPGYITVVKYARVIGVNLALRTRNIDNRREIDTFMMETDFDEEQLNQRIQTLHDFPEQIALFDRLMSLASETDGSRNRLIHVDAPAGCGKTYVMRTFAAAVQKHFRQIAACCATTGIASLSFYKGRTSHALFSVPVDKEEDIIQGPVLMSRLLDILQRPHPRNTNARIEFLRAARVFIWDEISMLNRHVFEAVEVLLRKIMNNNLPWGGKMIVTLGDWRQCSPVCEENAARTLSIDYQFFAQSSYAISVLSSPLWRAFSVERLTCNVRARTAPLFHESLMRVGNGEISEIYLADLSVLFPDVKVVTTLESALEWLYENNDIPSKYDPINSAKRSFIAPLNSEVRAATETVNNVFRLRLGLSMRSLKSVDSLQDPDTEVQCHRQGGHPSESIDDHLRKQQQALIDIELNFDAEQEFSHQGNDQSAICLDDVDGTNPMDTNDMSTEVLRSLNFPSVPPHKLDVCPGMVVIILRNMDPMKKVMNGTRMIVQSISRSGKVVSLRHANPEWDCGVYLLHRIDFICRIGRYGCTMIRKQFPMLPAYCITIHKSQAATLDFVVIDLRSGVFDHGQLYVAMSRVRNPQNLCLLLRPDQEYIRNIVADILLGR